VECHLQGVYRPRNAQDTALYHLVEDHFDELERVWEERYEREHGFWRPVIRHVVEQYLTCGDLRCGFARLRCPTCREDYLLPYSCKRRCFCPSCHQKRALLFAEHADQVVLGQVPVRQYVVTIPKMLRLCFKYDRKLLGELSRCFYDSIYEADPLLCRRCSGPLKIISLIDAPAIIEKILRHLKLWDQPERPPPAPAPRTLHYDLEIPAWEDDLGSSDGTE